jgi:hypothetical protein
VLFALPTFGSWLTFNWKNIYAETKIHAKFKKSDKEYESFIFENFERDILNK